jgi:hypothetical protein
VVVDAHLEQEIGRRAEAEILRHVGRSGDIVGQRLAHEIFAAERSRPQVGRFPRTTLAP